MPRKDPKLDALIRKTQAKVASSPSALKDARKMGRAWVESHQHDVARRRFDGSLFYQVVMERPSNPAVGTYITPDGRTLLFMSPEGIPTTQDINDWAAANGLGALKRLLGRAKKQPPHKGPSGGDVLADYRSFAESPVE